MQKDLLPKHSHADLPHQLHAIFIIICIFRVTIEGVYFSKIRFIINNCAGVCLATVACGSEVGKGEGEEPPANVNLC